MAVVDDVLWQQQKADIPSSPVDLFTRGSRIGVDILTLSFPGGLVVKNPPANAGDAGLIPRAGRSLGGGNGNPLQDSCLGNPMDGGAWWATVHGVTKSDTT